MKTSLPARARMDATVLVPLPSDLKRSLFEMAAREGVTASDLARKGIATILSRA